MPIAFYVIVVLLVFGGVLAAWARPKLRAMAAEDEAFAARYRKRLQEITALPLEEAHRQAKLLLIDPQAFECVLTSTPAETFDALAPDLRILFSRYKRIQAIGTEFVLDRELIAPFGWDWKEGPWHKHQFWQIGTSHEHGLILVKPHQEGIYDTDGQDDDLEQPNYPSIFHWLLMAASDFSDPKA